MNVIEAASRVLASARFDTWPIENLPFPCLGMESVGLLGFVFAFPDVQSLLENWRATEDAAIRRHAPSFKLAGDKAWNVYSVFATADKAEPIARRKLQTIEEDLSQTRKLTGDGVRDDKAMKAALLPLLPIIERPLLSNFDPQERLASRLDGIVAGVSSVMLNEDADATKIMQFLRQ